MKYTLVSDYWYFVFKRIQGLLRQCDVIAFKDFSRFFFFNSRSLQDCANLRRMSSIQSAFCLFLYDTYCRFLLCGNKLFFLRLKYRYSWVSHFQDWETFWETLHNRPLAFIHTCTRVWALELANHSRYQSSRSLYPAGKDMNLRSHVTRVFRLGNPWCSYGWA